MKQNIYKKKERSKNKKCQCNVTEAQIMQLNLTNKYEAVCIQ